MAFDPETDSTLQQFLDLFIEDVAIRLELESIFSAIARRDSNAAPDAPKPLLFFAAAYKAASDESVRRGIKWGARAAALQFIQKLKGDNNG